nr:serine/threonine-protein kinase [Microbacterium immunditiarum]
MDGRYQLHERVGEGGMAHVYRADDVLLGRTVAIKMMRSDADVLAASSRARSEVSALAMLNHPSLVTLLDARIEPERQRYLVMEFVAGPTLAERLRHGPLTPDEVAHLASELASGLHAVHEAGLLHRDVKPSNVLLGAASDPGVDFHVKLADFGLAQIIGAESVTTPGVVLGTAAYLSPEQVRGHGSSPASDIYALGLVLLEALTGERPFGHTSGIGAVLARLLEPPAIPDGIPTPWRALLEAMTAMDPAARPTALDVVDRVAGIPTEPTQATSSQPRAEPPTEPLIQTARMPAGRHIAPARRRRPLVTPPQGAWLRRAALATSATLAALMVCAAILADAASPSAPVIAGDLGPAPAYSEPFVLVDETDAPAVAPEKQAGREPTPDDNTQRAEHADKQAAAAAREAAKQTAAQDREAGKRAAAEQRAEDKASREAAREADKAAMQQGKQRGKQQNKQQNNS